MPLLSKLRKKRARFTTYLPPALIMENYGLACPELRHRVSRPSEPSRKSVTHKTKRKEKWAKHDSKGKAVGLLLLNGCGSQALHKNLGGTGPRHRWTSQHFRGFYDGPRGAL